MNVNISEKILKNGILVQSVFYHWVDRRKVSNTGVVKNHVFAIVLSTC